MHDNNVTHLKLEEGKKLLMDVVRKATPHKFCAYDITSSQDNTSEAYCCLLSTANKMPDAYMMEYVTFIMFLDKDFNYVTFAWETGAADPYILDNEDDIYKLTGVKLEWRLSTWNCSLGPMVISDWVRERGVR
jgi:hypothetical protein